MGVPVPSGHSRGGGMGVPVPSVQRFGTESSETLALVRTSETIGTGVGLTSVITDASITTSEHSRTERVWFFTAGCLLGRAS